MPSRADSQEPSPREQFGKRLRQLREAKGFSQEHLALVADVHRTYVSSVERGNRNVSLDIMVRLAVALEVPPAELFNGWEA